MSPAVLRRNNPETDDCRWRIGKSPLQGKPPHTGLEKCWLPECNSTRTRHGRVEPEVWFRIVHLGQNRPILAYDPEQTVEVALRPNGVFVNGTVSLMLRAPPSRLVKTAPLSKPPIQPKTSRVTELLHKAIEWQRQLDTGEVRNQGEIARQEGITRARVTQVLGMPRLAPEIQEKILTVPAAVHCRSVTERMLRTIGAITDHLEQLREFKHMI